MLRTVHLARSLPHPNRTGNHHSAVGHVTSVYGAAASAHAALPKRSGCCSGQARSSAVCSTKVTVSSGCPSTAAGSGSGSRLTVRERAAGQCRGTNLKALGQASRKDEDLRPLPSTKAKHSQSRGNQAGRCRAAGRCLSYPAQQTQNPPSAPRPAPQEVIKRIARGLISPRHAGRAHVACGSSPCRSSELQRASRHQSSWELAARPTVR